MSRIPSDTQKRISPEFQKRLLEFIDDEECTKYQFASRVGVCKEVILHATTYGIVPSLRPLIKIADYLNVSLEYLLGETNSNNFYKADSSATFHSRLEELKSHNHVKFSTIAHTMPFPESYFHEWMKEKTLPSLDYLKAIATYFEISIDYLLGRTDDKKN